MDNLNITLKQMRAFVAVSRAGSFTSAAQQLFITQSALSALVRNLETELEVRLLDRTTRRLELTDAGHDLLASLEHLLADIDRMTLELRDVGAVRRGRVRLGATPLLAASLLPEAIKSFRQRFPEVTVRANDDSTVILLHRMREGELDLVLATTERVEPDLHAQVLFSDRLILVCDKDHPLASRSSVSWSELAGVTFIAMNRGSGLRTLVEQALRTAGVDFNPAHEVNHVSTALAMAKAGVGVAVVPSYAVRHAGAVGIASVALHEPVVHRHVSMLRLAHRTPSAATTAMREHLIEFVQNHFSETPGLPN